MYKAIFDISSYGFQIESSNPSNDQLTQFPSKSLTYCSGQCSQLVQCSWFDYDSSSHRCRLFIYGYIISSSSSSSRVGSVKYSIDQYSKYNQTCLTNNSEINRYLICGNDSRYQCHQEFWWNGTMCTALYWAQGPQINVTSSLLRGWSLCYNGTYHIILNGSPLNDILNNCNRSKLLMACGELSNTNIYSVAAMSVRQDVIYNCSINPSCTYISNGVGWYFDENFSWGFAGQSDTVNRAWCDLGSTNPSTRLCWHTITGYDGYRCGSTFFNGPVNASIWQRLVFHTD